MTVYAKTIKIILQVKSKIWGRLPPLTVKLRWFVSSRSAHYQSELHCALAKCINLISSYPLHKLIKKNMSQQCFVFQSCSSEKPDLFSCLFNVFDTHRDTKRLLWQVLKPSVSFPISSNFKMERRWGLESYEMITSHGKLREYEK